MNFENAHNINEFEDRNEIKWLIFYIKNDTHLRTLFFCKM